MAPPGIPTMRIIQVNGWLGQLNGPLSRFIQEQTPDIVCLQEALLPLGEYLPTFRDQYDYISKLQSVGRLTHISFAPSWGYELTECLINVGNVILSKYPLTNTNQIHVNNSYFVAKRVTDYQPNTRTLQSALVSLPNGSKLAIANHQAYLAGQNARGDDESVNKMRLAARFLAELPRPMIFCGDLNVNPDTPTIQALDGLGLRNLTAETGIKTTLSEAHQAPIEDRNSVVCDYIFVSREIKVTNFSVAEEIVSDHKALILEFEI
jgi:endonuclease/exonuclease/phosphatase family metal-dependent hydrolase